MALSPREVEYCHCFLKHNGDNKLICDELCITYNTSACHRKSIYDKLNVSSLVEFTIYLLKRKDWKKCKNYWE